MAWRPWLHRLKPDLGSVVLDIEHPLVPSLGLTMMGGFNRGNGNYPLTTVQRLRNTRHSLFFSSNVGAGAGPAVYSGGPYGSFARNSGSLTIQILDYHTRSTLAWTNIMGTSSKTVVVGMTPVGAGGGPSANTYDLDRVLTDNALFLGVTRGNKTSGTDTGDKIYAYNWDGTDDAVGVTYTAGTPLVFAYTHNGVTLTVFKDGRRVNSVASGATADSSGLLQIGGSEDVHFLYLYDRVLSPGQVAMISRYPFCFFLEREPTFFVTQAVQQYRLMVTPGKFAWS